MTPVEKLGQCSSSRQHKKIKMPIRVEQCEDGI